MATKNTTAPRLEVKGIRKTFGQNAVLKGINLSVDAGEVDAGDQVFVLRRAVMQIKLLVGFGGLLG